MRLIVPLLIFLPLTAAAPPDEPAPPTYVDPRIRTVIFSDKEVVPIAVAAGYQLTVELGRGEHIENIAIGDSGGWLITPNKRGDFLFIKPLDDAHTTNLTVITEARTYLFELNTAQTADAPFTLRFHYEDAQAIEAQVTAATKPGTFRLHGSRAIKPAQMSDDGLKTTVILEPDQALPAIFAIDSDGKEMLLNGAMRDGRYVVDGIADQFILRLDKQVVRAVRKPRLKN